MKNNYIKLLALKKGIKNYITKEGKIVPTTLIDISPHYLSSISNKNIKNKIEFTLSTNIISTNKQKPTKSLISFFEKKNLYPFLNTIKSKISTEYLSNLIESKTLDKKYFLKRFFDFTKLEFEQLDIISKSKGLGFTGTIKRFNFKQGPKTHGSKSYRRPGSIGAGTTPGRVFKNKKMPGRCGNSKVTIKNIKILNKTGNRLLIKNLLPGKNNSLITLIFRF